MSENTKHNFKMIMSLFEAAKHPHTVILPPPCLTAGLMFLLWDAVLKVVSLAVS